jgi:hypothetical protein
MVVLRTILAVTAALALGGCGLSDHFSFMPSVLKYDAPPQPAVGYPDVPALAKAGGRNLFAHGPSRIEISTPLYDAPTRIYAVCARVNDGSGQPMMFATIMGSSFVSRRRAEPADGCDGQDFTAVDVD